MVNQTTTENLTNEAKALAISLFQTFNVRILNWAGIILGLGVAGLQAAPYNMLAPDATDLFNAANDMDKLRKVYGGSMFVASGATLNSGVPTLNGVNAFGYPFNLNPGKVAGLGY